MLEVASLTPTELKKLITTCSYLKVRQERPFLVDLDALFLGTLRRCIKDDESIQSFLVTAGVGGDIGKYCGELEQKVTALVDKLQSGPLTPQLTELKTFLEIWALVPSGNRYNVLKRGSNDDCHKQTQRSIVSLILKLMLMILKRV